MDNSNEPKKKYPTGKEFTKLQTIFSSLTIGGPAKGVTIKNAKYPLVDAKITREYQYGISNEAISGMIAEITVNHGHMLLIKIFQDFYMYFCILQKSYVFCQHNCRDAFYEMEILQML